MFRLSDKHGRAGKMSHIKVHAMLKAVIWENNLIDIWRQQYGASSQIHMEEDGT